MAEYSAIYETAVDRITSSFNTCSPAEQKLMLQILEEMSKTGYSYTLEQVYLSDFKEIPVSLDQFLNDPDYLGGATNGGKSVYPYWRGMMNNLFNAGNKYNEIILSGATRIGKTSTAVTILAYMLYKLMLYRDPHTYFDKKPTARFTLIFANLTKELANGVAFFEFNSTIKESPWFLRHGTMNKSTANPVYLPEGDKINILPVSDAAHALGMQVWGCLVGSTKILTDEGYVRIDELSKSKDLVTVVEYDPNSTSVLYANGDVELTQYVNRTIKITVNNSATFEGTLDHKMMMADQSYKQLQDITVGDRLRSIDQNIEVIVSNIETVYYDLKIPVYDVVCVMPFHNFVIVANDYRIISHNCLMDETNFARAGIKDISIGKARMKNLYDTVNARISGSFRIGGEVYGKLIASSSKNQDNDFLSDHIETQQRAGNDHLYLVDEPQWKILPKRMFSDQVFHFTVGDRYKRGFVIPEETDDEEHRAEFERQGYQVIEAPAELRKNFLADYDISLRDIAGISVAGAMGFITQESITPCVAQDRVNPFYEDIIVIGKDDDLEISDFFHIEKVPQELKYQQLNIHLDLAESHNRSGITGCCVSGNKVIEMDDGKKAALPFIKEVFAVGLEAPRGGRMSYQKVVNFIIYLRQNHFNVGTISADRFQSSFLLETLEQQGFDIQGLSVGMNEFIGLRNMLVDQRIELVKCVQQEDELIATQRMNNKIHHPEDEGGGHGDIAESLAGSSSTLISAKVTSRPPARNLAAIAAAVNKGTGSRHNPMSSSNTIGTASNTSNRPVHFPKLR